MTASCHASLAALERQRRVGVEIERATSGRRGISAGPAAAIIAALSVESRRLGRNVGISRASPRAFSSARSRLFADTPPATPMLFA